MTAGAKLYVRKSLKSDGIEVLVTPSPGSLSGLRGSSRTRTELNFW